MGQVTTHAQIQSEDSITGLKHSQHYSSIGLRTAVRLHISIGYIENLLSSIDS